MGTYLSFRRELTVGLRYCGIRFRDDLLNAGHEFCIVATLEVTGYIPICHDTAQRKGTRMLLLRSA